LVKRSYEVGVGFAWPCFAYVEALTAGAGD
jgi:hypothetical protein